MNTRSGMRLASLAAAATLALGALAACGSSNDDGAGSGGSGGGGGSFDVGVILPDTTTSVRWEQQDRPNLSKAFSDAGLKADIQNADGDKAKFGSLCDQMINEGVKVIIETDLDSPSGAACISKAKDAGVQAIDYDRLTLGGGASYYVSFDNVKVGELMGQGLEQCLTDEGKTKANIIFINGQSTDNNATLFKQGYQQALQPKFDSGDYKLVGDQSGEWDATKAANAFDQLYTQNKGDIDGIISANDGMAQGIIPRLKADGIAGKVPITGQDATPEGLAAILQGIQCGTVYKNTALEADAASKLAIALINGDTDTANSLATGTVKDTTLNQDVPSVLATPQWITKDSVKQVVQDGQASASDICKGIEKLCKQYGVQ